MQIRAYPVGKIAAAASDQAAMRPSGPAATGLPNGCVRDLKNGFGNGGNRMYPLEYPPRPEGTAEEQVRQLWEWLFRVIERLNAENGADGRNSDT